MKTPAAAAKLPYRPCAGLTVFNRRGEVFIGRRNGGPEHTDATHIWQMPQGGIDEGEDAYAAALRELYEETNIRSVKKLGAVKGWLTHAEATRRMMKKHYAGLEPREQLEACIEENVLVQIENLRTHPSVFAAMGRGALQLHAWVYEIESGQVDAFDPDAGQFVPVAEAGHGVAERGDRLGPRRQI